LNFLDWVLEDIPFYFMRAGWGTDGHGEANSRFPQFCSCLVCVVILCVFVVLRGHCCFLL